MKVVSCLVLDEEEEEISVLSCHHRGEEEPQRMALRADRDSGGERGYI